MSEWNGRFERSAAHKSVKYFTYHVFHSKHRVVALGHDCTNDGGDAEERVRESGSVRLEEAFGERASIVRARYSPWMTELRENTHLFDEFSLATLVLVQAWTEHAHERRLGVPRCAFSENDVLETRLVVLVAHPRKETSPVLLVSKVRAEEAETDIFGSSLLRIAAGR